MPENSAISSQCFSKLSADVPTDVDEDTPPPADSYSFISQFLFINVFPVLARGAKQGKLSMKDIPPVSKADEPLRAFQDYRRIRSSPGKVLGCLSNHVTSAILRLRFWKYMYAAFLLLFQNAGAILTPTIIQNLLAFLESEDKQANATTGYLWAFAMFGASIAQCLTIHRFWFEASVVGLHSQFALTTEVYVKALQLSSAARSKTTRGKLTNHMVTDASRLNDSFFFPSSHWFTWSAVITIVIGIYQLYELIGVAGLIGSAALTVFIPLSTVLSRQTKKLSTIIQEKRDHRGRVIGEAIAGIQTLKAYAWVEWMASKVFDARHQEVQQTRRKQFIQVIGDFVGTASPILMVAAMFALREVFQPDTPLTASVAFATVSWVTTIQFPLRTLPYTISSFIDAFVSIQRLGSYFDYEDAEVGMMSQWRSLLSRSASAINITDKSDRDTSSLRTSLLQSAHTHAAEQEEDRLRMGDWLQPHMLGPDVSGEASRAAAIAGSVRTNNAAVGWQGQTPPDSDAKELLQQDDEGKPRQILRNITFDCSAGELLMVLGPVGSGKSTLLSALIGDAIRISGMIDVNGPVAYCGQVPWILNRSIRENIVFCAAYRPAWYNVVVHACGLEDDIRAMQNADETMVGDSGITLSGGQKARLALARAVYADASVYILDDILSAVDAIVGAHIWENCIKALLLARSKAVVLATHAVNFASRAEVTKLLVLGLDGEQLAFAACKDMPRAVLEPLSIDAPPAPLPGSNIPRTDPAVVVLNPVELPVAVMPQACQQDDMGEKYASGAVHIAHIWRYIRAFGSVSFLAILAFLYVASQVLTVLISWWLTIWVSNASVESTSNEGLNGRSAKFYIDTYSILNASLAVLSLCRMLALTVGSLRASTKLHNSAIAHVLDTSAGFFATNPAGRILNRFLGDIGTIDDTVRSSISSLIMLLFNLVAVVVVIGITAPLTLIAVAVLSVFYYYLANRYRISARDLRRMQSVAKSPIYSNFSETLRGLSVIRAYGPWVASAFVRRHISLLHAYGRAWLAYWSANEFISTWLELIGAVVILITCVTAVYESLHGSITASDVGFLLNYVLQIPSIFMWLVRYVSQVETDAVAIERIVEYAELESEEQLAVMPLAQPAGRNVDPPPGVLLQDVWLRYRPHLPWVLKGLNLAIPRGAKVAVVGRTGAGKSTILQVLMRLYPFQEGCAAICNHLVNAESCSESRRWVVCALQDGVLFTGTVRQNLLGPGAGKCDRAAEDQLLWRSLEAVGVRSLVERMPGQLEAELAESGGNVSAGERALLCLARARLSLLRHEANNADCVFLCDEPTASVDYHSDAMVHDAILGTPSTVLCICHRLHHVGRFDYVAVIDNGQCVEFGPPDVLREQDGVFRELQATVSATAVLG